MPPSKSSARSEIRRRRATLADTASRSAGLCEHLRADPRWTNAERIAAFVGASGEPDTRPLLRAALAEGKALWLPRVRDGKGGRSTLHRVRTLDGLVENAFGLQEPADDGTPGEAAIVPSMELDLVLVPGLAFDGTGARLGHGAGHYDRLLAPVAALDHPVRVGVCFAEFFEAAPDEPLPTEAHDVPMHVVATDQGIVACAHPDAVPHTIEPAASGRAKCRACGETIAKGTLRFGERVDNPYGDGLATYWFHLRCGALRRPEPFAALLAARPALALDEREALTLAAESGIAAHRLPRLTQAMPSPSGRARCRHCRALIDKAAWRCSLSIWQDGRFEPMGFIHATCAQAYFRCADPDALLARAAHGSPSLDDGALAALAADLAVDGSAPATAEGSRS